MQTQRVYSPSPPTLALSGVHERAVVKTKMVLALQNLQEAAVWFEKAAASGVPQAMLNLGKMLENVSERHSCSV